MASERDRILFITDRFSCPSHQDLLCDLPHPYGFAGLKRKKIKRVQFERAMKDMQVMCVCVGAVLARNHRARCTPSVIDVSITATAPTTTPPCANHHRRVLTADVCPSPPTRADHRQRAPPDHHLLGQPSTLCRHAEWSDSAIVEGAAGVHGQGG